MYRFVQTLNVSYRHLRGVSFETRGSSLDLYTHKQGKKNRMSLNWVEVDRDGVVLRSFFRLQYMVETMCHLFTTAEHGEQIRVFNQR
jgi:hypothetical protein